MMKNNIVLVHSDQHRFDCVGVNGHGQINTPNLDRLASEGMNFSHAFTPSPICSPARGSLLSGLWPTQHGCINIPKTESYSPMHDDIVPFTALLKTQGYRSGYVGKFHNETRGNPTDYGVDEYIPRSQYGKWRRSRGLPSLPRENGFFGETDPHIEAQESQIAWGADHAIRMIEEGAASDRPFFVRWDPVEPHLPNIVPEPYASMYPPESIEPWPSFHDSLEGKPYVQRLQRRRWGTEGWGWDKWAAVVGRYMGDISLIDHQVGRILDRLDELGVAENTLVIYTTDHGDFCGGHGMMDKHYAAYDDIVRVPLIMRLPGQLAAKGTCDSFVCHSIDLASTICAAAGIEPPGAYMGRDLIKLAGGNDLEHQDVAFSMYQGCQMGLWSWRMARNRRWKYVYHATAEPELYNIEKDPGELINRAKDTECRTIAEDLRLRLLDWMVSIHDPLLNQWTRTQLQDGIM